MAAGVSANLALRYDLSQPRTPVRLVRGSVRVWDSEAIDTLTETVVTRLLVEGAEARAVAVDLAARLAARRAA